MTAPRLSAVVPCRNEAPALGELRRRLSALPLFRSGALEVLLVDDGSTDGTWAGLSAWAREAPLVRALRLERNVGNQAAMLAGVARARGAAVAVLDADLQDPPELLEPMLAAMAAAGAAAAVGLKRERADAAWGLALAKTLATAVLPFRRGEGDFCILDAEAARALAAAGGPATPFRVLRRRVLEGRKVYYFPYNREPRAAGTGKFTLLKLARLWARMVRGAYLPAFEPAGPSPAAVAEEAGSGA